MVLEKDSNLKKEQINPDGSHGSQEKLWISPPQLPPSAATTRVHDHTLGWHKDTTGCTWKHGCTMWCIHLEPMLSAIKWISNCWCMWCTHHLPQIIKQPTFLALQQVSCRNIIPPLPQKNLKAAMLPLCGWLLGKEYKWVSRHYKYALRGALIHDWPKGAPEQTAVLCWGNFKQFIKWDMSVFVGYEWILKPASSSLYLEHKAPKTRKQNLVDWRQRPL